MDRGQRGDRWCTSDKYVYVDVDQPTMCVRRDKGFAAFWPLTKCSLFSYWSQRVLSWLYTILTHLCKLRNIVEVQRQIATEAFGSNRYQA